MSQTAGRLTITKNFLTANWDILFFPTKQRLFLT
jgi:hypothetical protein